MAEHAQVDTCILILIVQMAQVGQTYIIVLYCDVLYHCMWGLLDQVTGMQESTAEPVKVCADYSIIVMG